MPFPLAHPAAILPFRRYCPRWFSFPALVVGSLVPDLSYCSGNVRLDELAHRPEGAIIFAFPVGMLCLAIFYWLRSPVRRLLPGRLREIFGPFLEEPAGPIWVMCISVVLGALTHIFLDSLTHRDGWFVQHLPLLQIRIGEFLKHNVRIYQVLWFGCTLGGVGWLAWTYLCWLKSRTGSPRLSSARTRFTYALGACTLVLLLALAHRLIRAPDAFYLIIVSMVVVSGIFVLHTVKASVR